MESTTKMDSKQYRILHDKNILKDINFNNKLDEVEFNFNLFGEIPSKDDLKDLLRVKKPSLETFRNILFTVRKAQGYTTEEALDSVEETIELNMMIDELNRDKKTFFQQKIFF